MTTFVCPSETSRHTGTIMCFPTTSSINSTEFGWNYPSADAEATREELANIARAIAKYEPVQIFVRDPTTYHEDGDSGYDSAHRLLGSEDNVKIHLTANVDCLWARDVAPIFVRTRNGESVENSWGAHDDPGMGFNRESTSSSVVGMLLSFNQWGRKLPPSPDSYLAATACQALKVSAVLAPFVGEGGGIEVDGRGTLIATESALLNPNRNPGMSKETLEKHLAWSFGAKKIIWIPGNRGGDITDDHIDALARFSGRPGVVLLSRPFVPANATEEQKRQILDVYETAKEILESTTDAEDRPISTVSVPEPDPAKVFGAAYDEDSAPSVAYVNFLIADGAVIMAAFGDMKADAEAARVLSEHFPERKLEQILLHQLPIQGGGIHCATQQYYL